MMGSQNEPVFIDDKSGVDFSAYIPDPKDLMNSQANGTKPVNGLENTLNQTFALLGTKTKHLLLNLHSEIQDVTTLLCIERH